MLWAGVRGFQRLGSRIEVVAEGVKWEIHSMRRLGYKQVIYETDSLFLAKMINGHTEVWPKLQPIIQEIHHTLSENPHYKIVFYSRDGNMAAYRIAKEAFSLQNHLPKLYYIVPDWLKPVFETDRSDVNQNFVG
ncbi:hypothetical protein F2Q69_00027820 [Brassica cretica]|uniref:RNase H type-1 domain-containing protein n=1 Tax=Brassica cretica TaxID=69181 RepID=A0A8S9S9E8_BRACR|nr:hypothetical protein F2Q69_00027820 [Brassica cretica]